MRSFFSYYFQGFKSSWRLCFCLLIGTEKNWAFACKFYVQGRACKSPWKCFFFLSLVHCPVLSPFLLVPLSLHVLLCSEFWSQHWIFHLFPFCWPLVYNVARPEQSCTHSVKRFGARMQTLNIMYPQKQKIVFESLDNDSCLPVDD